MTLKCLDLELPTFTFYTFCVSFTVFAPGKMPPGEKEDQIKF